MTRHILEGGKRFRVAGGDLTPYASLTGERIDQAAFTEQGAAGFGLTSPAQSHTATLVDLGVRYGRSFTWVGGRSTLSGEAAYERVLSGANLGFTAALAGTPTAYFTAQGQDLARNTALVGVDLNTRVDHSWGWFLDLGAQFGRGRLQGKTATAGVRINW
ncbi:autotransporter outer membrane beta-barrel domain-containing protein [Metallibacterium scheffleri]